MATRCFPFFLVFLSAHGFLLDKTQSTSGLSGTSNQYVTASELFGETKTRQLEDQQLRRYIDNAFAVLTSQLEHKFDALDQKFIRCENQSVPSQANETLEQKYIDLERKYTDLDRKHTDLDAKYTDLDRKYMDLENKYIQMQSMNNNKFYLLKSHFLTIQNKTSQISNDKPIDKLTEIQTNNSKQLLRLGELETNTSKQLVGLGELETNTSKQLVRLGELETNTSKQLVRLAELETNTSKQLVRLAELETNTSKQLVRLEELESNTRKQFSRLEQNHISTTAGIISKMEALEKQENKTMSVMQTQINKNAERGKTNETFIFHKHDLHAFSSRKARINVHFLYR
ncbi:unnamed protein product [Mytilus edulis]|uniref:Uncharacterized protein n=1 Tax=Mytilus edulis TaxID=6550 RepID=A0A8S3UV65_MYTED|nr:unnamed protein product [Mytilus edulis]